MRKSPKNAVTPPTSDRAERSAVPRLKPLAAHMRRAWVSGLIVGLHVGAAYAGPQGGNVVGGSGSITRPDANTTLIKQQSTNLAIDWQKFNVKSNELVQFRQPGRNAQALNRIFDQNASQIHGRIRANGRVLLMNPNGVIFGPNASVNVNGLVAAGMRNIPVEDFMAGKFRLEGLDGADGAVINQGSIEAGAGGDVTLVGKSVRNEGVIIASAGRVNLASGNKVTLDFDGDGLMRFAVDEAVLENTQALDDQVANTGTIAAEGGDVVMAASAARDVFTNAINNSGIVRAGRIDNSGGKIRLVGLGPGASVLNTGVVDASAGDAVSDGGFVDITGANIRNAGHIAVNAESGDGGSARIEATDTTLLTDAGTVTAVSTAGGTGGKVQLLGERVGLTGANVVDVSGTAGGGEALIGGDYQGRNAAVRNAQATVVGSDATIRANAGESGDGGKVIVWADDYANFSGAIEATGGAEGGDGGFVETSGKDILVARGRVDASAPQGNAGTWLLDPRNVSLEQLGGAGDDSTGGAFDLVPPPPEATFTPTADSAVADIDQIVSSLEGGTSVTINTGSTGAVEDGDITVTDPISVTLGSAVTLALEAVDDIFVNSAITASGDALSIILEADSDASGAGNVTVDAVITTNGGDVHLLGEDVAINQNIIAGAGNINFVEADTNAIELGGGAAQLDQAELDRLMSTGTVTIGEAMAADGTTITATGINVEGSLTVAGTTGSTFVLKASDTIFIGDAAVSNETIAFSVTPEFSAQADADGDGTGDFQIDDDATSVTLTLTGATNTISAADFVLNANGTPASVALNAGGTTLTISDTGAMAGIGLGATAVNGFQIEGAELGRITAAALNLDTTGNVTVDDLAAANSFGIMALNVLSGAAIDFSNNAAAFENAFTASADGSISVNEDITTNNGDIALEVDADMNGAEMLGIAAGFSLTAGANVVLTGNGTDDTLAGVSTVSIGGGDNTNDGTADTYTFSDFANLTGTTGNDTFTFTATGTLTGQIDGDANGGGGDTVDYSAVTAAVTVDLNGGAGGVTNIENVTGDGTNDTLVGANAANVWTIGGGDNINDGTVGGVAFTDFSNLTAGDNTDAFNFDDGATLGGTIDGSATGADTIDVSAYTTGVTIDVANTQIDAGVLGSYTGIETFIGDGDGGAGLHSVTGPNVANTWAVNGTDDVSLGGVTYQNFASLTAGTDTDAFNFSDGATLSGTIDGSAAGADTIDVSAYMTGVTIDVANTEIDAGVLGSYTGIETFVGDGDGGAGLHAVTGPNAVNAWSVTNADDTMLGGVVYQDFAILNGGSDNDTFTFTADGIISGSIDGMGDGGGGDTVDVSAATNAINLRLEPGATGLGLQGIELVIGDGDGGAGVHTLTGPDAVNAWSIGAAVDDGTIGGVSFQNVANLVGGSDSDTFTFSAGASITGQIDGAGGAGGDTVDYSAVTAAVNVDLNGGAGGIVNIENVVGDGANDTLIGANGANLWTIGGGDNINDGTVGAVTFTDFSNLTAGTNTDAFVFSDMATLGGTIDGAATGQDSIDVSGYAATVTVNLETSSIGAGILASFNAIETFTGDGAMDVIVGPDAGATWTIGAGGVGDGINDGTVGTVNFENFANLSGGSGSDTYAVLEAGSLTGGIADAGGAADTIDYSAVTSTPITITVGDGSAFDRITSAPVTEIEVVIASTSGTTDAVTGTAGVDTFTIDNATATNDFTIGGISYRRFETIDGGADNDIFNVSGDHTGNLVGGNGDDVFNFSGSATLTGQVDGGGAGGTDTLDFSGYATAVSLTPRGSKAGDVTSAPTDPIDEMTAAADFTDIEDVINIGILGDNVPNFWLIKSNGEADQITNTDPMSAVLNSYTNITGITGGTDTDYFIFESDGMLTSINGGGGAGVNTVKADDITDAAATFALSAATGGSITVTAGTTTFTDIDVIIGSDVDDAFNVTGPFAGSITGGGSAGADVVNYTGSGLGRVVFGTAVMDVDTIIGDGGDTSFILAGGDTFTIANTDDAGTIALVADSAAFNTVSNIEGTAGNDMFIFAGTGTITGQVDGAGGANDTADYTGATGAVTVTLINPADLTPGLKNMDVVAGSGDETLVGTSVADTFNITNPNEGNVVGLLTSFTGIANLDGAAGDDFFVFEDGDTIGSVFGGSDSTPGGDTIDLSAYTTALTWNVTGSGTVNGIAFDTVEYYVGGMNNDDFVVANTGTLNLFGADPDTVDGGTAGATDTISYALKASAVTVVLDNVTNIDTITGGSTGNDTLTGTTGMDTFQTTNTDEGNVPTFASGTLAYLSFENIEGGANNDMFVLDHDVSGSVSGGAGNDQFLIENNDIAIGSGIFGGANSDTFKIGTAVEAGDASDNFVTLTADLDGGDGNDTFTLVGPAGAPTGGSVLIGNITGGNNNDTLNFGFPTGAPPTAANNEDSRIVGMVDLGAGTDTLDFSGSDAIQQFSVTSTDANGSNGTLLAFGAYPINLISGGFMGVDSQIGNTKGPLVGNNVPNTWIIDGPDSGSLNGTPFVNFQLVGGTDTDSFEFRTNGSISFGIDGGITGINTVLGDSTSANPGAINITGANTGTIDADTGDAAAATTFSNIDIVQGGIGDDVFTFSMATTTFAGQIDGLAGSDTLDLSTLNGPRTVTLTALGGTDGYDGNDAALNTSAMAGSGFSNIDVLIGSGAGDVLVAPGTDTFFFINALNAGTVSDSDAHNATAAARLAFSGFSTLRGRAGADEFEFFGAAGTVAGQVDGGLGDDKIDLLPSAVAGVTVSLNDTGTGGEGRLGTAVGVIAGGFDRINAVDGRAADSLAVNTPVTTTNNWAIVGLNQFTLDGSIIPFTGFGGLVGGAGPDIFTFEADGRMAAGIDGAGGINSLVGSPNDDTVALTAAGTGTLTVDVGGTPLATTFMNIQNFDGDDPTMSDTLDYSGFAGAIVIDLQAGTATGTASIANFEDFIGNATPGSNSLTGRNVTNQWDITADNTGSINVLTASPVTFSSFGILVGGSAVDTFDFAGAFNVARFIDGAGGTDVFDFTDDTRATIVSFVNSSATGIFAGAANGFASVESVIGSATSGANSLTATNNADTWTITSADGGTLNGVAFQNFETIDGALGNDVFTATAAGTISTLINGGGGTDTLRGNGFANVWNVSGNNAGTANGSPFAQIENLDALGSAATLTQSAGVGLGGMMSASTLTLNTATITAGGNPFNVVGNLVSSSAAQSITAGGPVTVSGTLNDAGSSFTINSTGNTSVGGAVNVAALSVTTNGGNYSSGALTAGATTVNTGGGQFTSGAINGSAALTVNTAGGNFTSGAIGVTNGATVNAGAGSAAIGGGVTANTFALTSGGATVGAVSTNGAQTYTGPVAFGGGLTGSTISVAGGAGAVSVAGDINASRLNFTSANGSVRAVTTSGSQTYGGATTFQGNLTGANLVFNGTSTFNGDVLIQSSTDIYDFNGAVLGSGNLDIIPTANTDIFIGTDSGPGTIASNQFAGFQGHLIIGALLNPLDSPAEEAMVVNPPGVTANLITVDQNFNVGGDVTLIGSNIELNANVGAAANTGQVTLVAVGDSQANGGAGPGDITGPLAGTASISGGKAVLIANSTVVNAGNVRLDLNGGDLLLAASANEDEPQFDPSSNASSVDFDPTTLAIIAGLGLQLQSVQVVFTNPASALTGLQNVQFIDVGLFEEELTLFGVIGNGIALSLDQCEEAEGCAPNVSEEELDALIAQIEGRITEIRSRLEAGTIDADEGAKLLAGFERELENFRRYKTQLTQYAEGQDDFGGDDFEELDDFADEFDEALPEDDFAEPLETEPAIAEPGSEPELEPTEEAFEELDEEPAEPEPFDEFEELEEELQDEFEEPVIEEQPEEIEEELDEFEELGQRIDDALIMRLTAHANVNEFRGVIGLSGDGRVTWTGDIVLPSFARRF